jgi:hypothetical protein
VRVAFASARSSPGVTTATLACASVWPGQVLLVEAVEDGGALAARFALPPEPGMTTLAAAIRHDPSPDALQDHLQPLPGTDGRITALLGPPAVEAAQPLLRAAGPAVAGLLDAVDDATVLVDAGRLAPSPAAGPLIAGADRFVLVTRPRVEELQTLARRLPTLRELGPAPEIVLVGDKPYGPGEIAATLGCPVAGVLADDRAAADALAGTAGTHRVRRSLLLRTAASLVDRLIDGHVPPASPSHTEAAVGEPAVGPWSSLTRRS